jgi:DNA-directed RNA polymerase subunit alpha
VLSSILPKLKIISEADNIGIFEVEPLENTYGITVGNALRRALLSAIPGVAITSVRIKGAMHEFSTIDGMKEDVLDFILNIKQIRLKKLLELDKSVTLKLTHKGEGIITAKDIECPSEVEIVNKDQYLARLSDKKNTFEAEFTVEEGRGYWSVEDRHLAKKKSVDFIPVDALFTPVTKVNFKVEPTRVGQQSNYDKLILEVGTDGSLEPVKALNLASAILVEHLGLFINEKNYKPEILDLSEDTSIDAAAQIAPPAVHLPVDMTIEDLGLSTRVLNSLHAANINTVSELIECSPEDLTKLKNFGQKSLREIEEQLNERHLSLKKGE